MTSITYRHRHGLTGLIAWQTESEVGIDCIGAGSGFTWAGSVEAFLRDWRQA